MRFVGFTNATKLIWAGKSRTRGAAVSTCKPSSPGIEYMERKQQKYCRPGNDMIEARHREGFDEKALFSKDLRHRDEANCQHNVNSMQSRESCQLPLQCRRGTIQDI